MGATKHRNGMERNGIYRNEPEYIFLLKSHLFKNFLSFGLNWSLMRNDILLLLLYKFDIYFLLLWSAMNFWYERYTSSIIIIIKG